MRGSCFSDRLDARRAKAVRCVKKMEKAGRGRKLVAMKSKEMERRDDWKRHTNTHTQQETKKKEKQEGHIVKRSKKLKEEKERKNEK